MADNKEIYTNENDTEEMYVTIDTEEGELYCAVIDIFEFEENNYIVLQPLDENGECPDGSYFFYRYYENMDDPNEEPVLEYIESDEEYDKIDEFYDNLLESEEFDEIIDEE